MSGLEQIVMFTVICFSAVGLVLSGIALGIAAGRKLFKE